MTEYGEAEAAVVRMWPGGTERVTVDGVLARTGVLVCGSDRSPALLCVAGGGDTGAAWYAQAAGLARRYRVIAPDLPGDAGRTERRALRTRDDLPDWVDEVVRGVGVSEPIDILAHGYGAQIATSYALRYPDRVAGLTLLDPAGVFTPVRATTVLRSIPLLAAPSGRRRTRFTNWETDGHWPPSAEFGRLAHAAADGPRFRVVIPQRPRRGDLNRLRALPRGLTVVIADRSKFHNGPRLARAVARNHPWIDVQTLPVAHHQLPFAYRPPEG